MDISKVKYFMYRSLSLDDRHIIHVCKSIDEIMSIDKWSKRCLGTYGIIETEQGDISFEIELTYDGEPYVWQKFMHIISFLKFHPYSKIYCYDESSYKYIIKTTESFIHEWYDWEIIKKY